MKPKEHEAIITKIIGNLADPATVTKLLQDLRDDNDKTYTDFDNLTISSTTDKEEIGRLRDTNMSLFLRIGQTAIEETGSSIKVEDIPTFDDIIAKMGV